MAVDYWSWAILVYEMITGTTPFYEKGSDQMGLFKNIVRGFFEFPHGIRISKEAVDLVQKMLVRRSANRLGSFARGMKDIRDHPWFKGFDFDALSRKEIAVPIVPKIRDPLDSSNFGKIHYKSNKKVKTLTEKQNQKFKNF